MAHSLSASKAVALALVLLFPLLLSSGEDAGAQSPEEDAPLSVRLVSQPVWHEPGDTLHIKLRVINKGNEPVKGFGIRVGVFERARSRSALHDSFEAEPVSELYVQTQIHPHASLEPGASSVVEVNNPMTDFNNLLTAEDGGVFPVTLAVTALPSGTILDWVTTPLIYYPEHPVDPLDLVTVVPLVDEPSLGPDGSFLVPSEGSIPLQQAASSEGWMRGLVDALRAATTPPPDPEPTQPRKDNRRGKHKKPRKPRKVPPPIPPLHVAIAPDPRLLEELTAMADGYRTSEGEDVRGAAPEAEAVADTLRTLRSVLAQPGVQTLLVPYGYPDLTTLSQLPAETTEQLLEHLSEGRLVTEELLPFDLDGAWLFPPDGRLDTATLELLQLGERAHRVASISAAAVAPTADPDNSGCPTTSLTFACPAAITTDRGTTKGYIADQGLAERLAILGVPGSNDRLTLQQFFAETSMIREEQPGIPGRVVQATIPARWDPSPGLSKLLFDNLKEAPWLRALTPSEGLRGLDPLPERQLEPAIATATPETTTFYTEHLAPARTVIQSYADVAIEEDARVRRLQHNLLVAQSYMNRDASTATNYADSSREEAQAELDKIRIIGVADVTLTSSRGKFQLVLANGTDSTVDIEIEFDSEQLEFDPELLERLSTTYSPGNHPLTITATARASGKFPLTVRVNSPGSDYEIERKDINIRSTAYNNIALGITVGALMFLILFYLVRGLRRRTRAKGSPEADPA